MKVWRHPALAAVLAVFLISAAPAPAPVELRLQPVLENDRFRAMDVAVSFTGEADGETVLELPDSWGGETDLWKALSDLRAEGATLSPGADAAHRSLRHAPGARITVRYRVQNAQDGPATGRNDYRPLIRPGYFQLLGNTIVALPERVDLKSPARFVLEGMPAGATFASDLEHGAARPLKVLDLVESISVGGDFRVLDVGGGVRLALRGSWPRDDATWRERLARIVDAQRACWRAPSEPYLVTVLPLTLDPGAVSIGGTGRGDAFAFFATPENTAERIDTILAHEMMHTWISDRIGGLSEQDEAGDYWLSEGFTDWASMRSMVKAGLWTPEDFAAAFNAILAAHDVSPARTAPNARIVEAFWTDAEIGKLPYRRGMLLAALWDVRVRAATNGRKTFDDVLRAMQETARRRGDVTAAQILPVAVERIARIDIRPDLDRIVRDGGDVPLPPDALAPCGAIVGEPRRAWDRGFDFDATQRADWVIQGVREGSNAYKAGLRNGMRLRQWSESSDQRDPEVPVTAGVQGDGAVRTLTWVPASDDVRTVRRLVLADLSAPAARGACIARLGGAPHP